MEVERRAGGRLFCSTLVDLQRRKHGLQLMPDVLVIRPDRRLTLSVADDLRYADRHCQVRQVSRCCSRTPAHTACTGYCVSDSCVSSSVCVCVCVCDRTMKSHRAAVLLNLCVALIVANIVFLAGVDKTVPPVNNINYFILCKKSYTSTQKSLRKIVIIITLSFLH